MEQLPNTYQLKISLEGSKPPIWRRLLVPGDITLDRLHRSIQIAMGWSDYHLHQFITKDREFYGIRDDELDFNVKDESLFQLNDLLKSEKDSLIYEYDFGDSWALKVVVEKILPADPDEKLPYCVTGKRACPPEDCGGIWGYANLLAILDNPEHEQYEEMREWVGDEFDPAALNRREINRLLIE